MNYTCPYCGRYTTITDPNKDSCWYKINVQKPTLGDVGFNISAITCPNEECHKLVLVSQLTKARWCAGSWQKGDVLQTWRLLPESEAKVLPDYISDPIKSDYYEACRIRDLSPKASATLARRCLQGMIRDFWKISKSRLKDEVDALEEKVDQDTWSSIDAVRSVGNIGAHMEKDINIIVDVEPEEAQLLIGLIEQLVDDWYVDRENRRTRSEALKALADAKKNKPVGSLETE
ncbi:MAG: DUF4145 domain-containing protein [Parcubacteria group bacterium]